MFCEVSAVDRNINKWQKLNELRKTDPRISGGYYTTEFLKTYRPDFYSEGYSFFPEFVEVAKINGELSAVLQNRISLMRTRLLTATNACLRRPSAILCPATTASSAARSKRREGR